MIKVYEFEWDEANKEKNWVKHRVMWKECEEIFTNEPLDIAPDPLHSQKEMRYAALGKTNSGRLLFVVFTTRQGKIRIISARNQDNKERRQYESKQI